MKIYLIWGSFFLGLLSSSCVFPQNHEAPNWELSIAELGYKNFIYINKLNISIQSASKEERQLKMLFDEIELASLPKFSVHLECKLSLLTDEMGCHDGRGDINAGESQIFAFSLDSELSDTQYRVQLKGSDVSLVFRREFGKAVALAEGREIDIAAFLNTIKLFYEHPIIQNGEVTHGRLDFNFLSDMENTHDVSITVADLSFSDEDGSVATEAVSAVAEVNVLNRHDSVVAQVKLTWQQGEILVGDFYVPQPISPIEFSARATSYENEKQTKIELSELRISQKSVFSLKVDPLDGDLEQDLLRHGDAYFKIIDFQQFYSQFMASSLLAFGLDDLDVSGQMDLHLRYEDKKVQSIELNWSKMNLSKQKQIFHLGDSAGHWMWKNKVHSEVSWASWDKLLLYGIPIESNRAEFISTANSTRLLQVVAFQVFDGEFQINAFSMDPSNQSSKWSLDIDIENIDMARLSHAFGWPEFQGKLNGHMPGFQWKNERMEFDGEIIINAFDGQINVSDLALERPFGVLPSVESSIGINNLDLGLLTDAFSFGHIEGRLEGYVKELRLLDWKPVQFDALLVTPRDDRSKHKISQRAVDSLSNIGGGGAAAISSTFLRIFDDFSYSRLGLKCRLQNNICAMGGVISEGDRFFIVKGSGLPRLDIVGSNRSVDWPVLLQQLQAGMNSPSFE